MILHIREQKLRYKVAITTIISDNTSLNKLLADFAAIYT